METQPSERGGKWVIAQSVLFLTYAFIPPFHLLFPPTAVRFAGLALLTFGAFLLLPSVPHLGRNLTPYPKPKRSGTLVTRGVYRFIRHPMYSGLFFLLGGYALWDGHAGRLGTALVLAVFFDRKARTEERLLGEAFPRYAEYSRRTKKFIPWIY